MAYCGGQQPAYNQVYGQTPVQSGPQWQHPPLQQVQPQDGGYEEASGYGDPPIGSQYLNGQPMQQGPPCYLGSRLASDPFAPFSTIPLRVPKYDPTTDVDAIRNATKGLGTNENALNRFFCIRVSIGAHFISRKLKVYRSEANS